jgi:hypothetical protein
MKHEYATHVFTHKGNVWHVRLYPDGRAYVNEELACEFALPNTTKTRALVALKHYLGKRNQ